MSVVDGQAVNAAVTNAAFVSKTATTGNTATGIINLDNTTDVNSGATINNIQRGMNETFDTVGMSGVGDASRKDYPSTFIVDNGDNRKVAIGKLDAEFAGTGAHAHSGVDGDGTKISASNLEDFNNYFAEFQEFTKDTVSGTTTDVTTALSAKTPGGGTSAAGVITSPPDNRCVVQNKDTETNIEDGEGQRVYGRITESSGTWTLSFFTNEAGTETAHSLSSQNIRVFFVEVFTSETRPTVPSNVGKFGSLDFTADIVDATASQRGAVSTGTQTFGGAKTFNNAISTIKADVASAATIAALSSSTGFVRITGATATTLQGIASGTDGKRLVLWNGSTQTLTVSHQNGSASASDRIITATGASIAVVANSGIEFIYDSSASRWVIVSTSGSGSGGGPGSLRWYFGDSLSPLKEVLSNGLEVYNFSQTDDQIVYAKFTVPEGYTAGSQILLKNGKSFSNTNTGNFLFKTTSYLFKAGQNGTLTPTGHDSTNTQQAVNGTQNFITTISDIDLTDVSGEINSVAVSSGDTILIKLIRSSSTETSGVADNVRLLIDSFELDMSS